PFINQTFNLETVTTKYQSSYRIRGSRFLGYLLTVACLIENTESFHRELQDFEHLLVHTEPLDSSYEIIARR
ncbi:MAG: hypothetical protein WD510_02420, partial [Balneolaceae bacterium]